MTVVLPNSGDRNWSGRLNTAISGIDVRVTTLESKLIAQQSRTAPTTYSLVLTDAGKHIYASGTGLVQVTIPSNTSVAFAVGTVILLVTSDTATLRISRANTSTTTLVCEGLASNQTYNISANRIVTLLKVGAERWILAGTGLTVN
jgi:hypothetical protein